MAFPTTGILDSFDRANEGPPPSANWTTGVRGTTSGLQVVSNACVQTVADFNTADAWWNVGTFGPDSEVYVTYTTVQSGPDARLYLRLQQPGSSSTVDGYLCLATDTSLSTYRLDNGAFTQLGATETITLASGDSLGIEGVGSTITPYQKTGGVWSAITTRTDATYGAGYIGMALSGTGWVVDGFGGGAVVTAEAFLENEDGANLILLETGSPVDLEA